jgi:lysozyme
VALVLLLALVLALTALPTTATAAVLYSGHHHVVKPGETLSEIARYYGVTVTVLARYNGIVNSNHIYVGQKLRIPAAGSGHFPYPGHPPVGCSAYHHVKRGDTLSSLARWYGVSIRALAALNGISNTNHIYVGQKLCVPSAYAPSKPPPGHGHHSSHYKVKHGDTLSQIARWHGTSVHHLMRVNGISNPNYIYVGQLIRIY